MAHSKKEIDHHQNSEKQSPKQAQKARKLDQAVRIEKETNADENEERSRLASHVNPVFLSQDEIKAVKAEQKLQGKSHVHINHAMHAHDEKDVHEHSTKVNEKTKTTSKDDNSAQDEKQTILQKFRKFTGGIEGPGMNNKDKEIVKGCNREAMMKGSGPLMLAGVGLTAYLQRNAPAKTILPFALALVGGYVGGKLIFSSKCRQRVADSDSHSTYANQVRADLKAEVKEAPIDERQSRDKKAK